MRPQWLVLYTFSIEPFIFPLFVNIQRVLDVDTFRELHNFTDKIMINLLLIIIVFEYLVKRREIFGLRRISFAGSMLVVFLVLQNTLIHFDWGTLYASIRYVILLPLFIILVLINKKTIPSYKDSLIFLLLVVSLQVIWAILEFNGIYPFLIFYTGYGAVVSEGLISGTFVRFNNMTNFLTTIYLCFAFDYFINKKVSSFFFLVFSFVIFLLVLVSGAKMSIVLFLFIWIVNIFYNLKRNRMMSISTIIILLLFISVIDFFPSSDGINRAIEGFNSIIEGSEKNNTSSLSTYLYDNYFHLSPIIGNGLSWKGEYAYDSIRPLIDFKADARLMYTLVEYGIVGTLLYFIYFFKLLWMPVRVRSKHLQFFVFFSFSYFSIMTFTEGGFFDYCNVAMVFVYISMLQLEIINKQSPKGNIVPI